MKKNYIILIFTVVLSSFMLTACKKFLEVAPDNRTELNTKEKIQEILGTAYPQGNWIPVAEAMSDNATDKGEGRGVFDLNLSLAYLYQDNTLQDQDNPDFYWNNAYEAINSANQALEAIANLGGGDDLKSEKAEALLCRAYAHFMLVTLYAKPYNTSTSSSDLGVPYVTEVEKVVNKKYSRETVAKIYELIEADLEAAIPDLDDTRYKVPKYHFTKMAAYAFASRFYLFKKEYDKVLKYTNLAFPASYQIASNLRPWKSLFLGTSTDIRVNFTKATLPSNLLLVESSSLWNRFFARTRFGWTETLRDGTVTERGVASNTRNVVGNNRGWSYRWFIQGQDNPLLTKWNEFFYTRNDPRFGLPYVMIPLFTVEEVLFNRAEANVYLNNNVDALKDLNIFVSQRFDNYNESFNITEEKAMAYYENDNPKDALINTILNFRRIEFLHEGMRWLDILRYDIPVKHEIKDLNLTVVQTIELPAGDKRRQWQLPEAVESAGVIRNPR